MDWKPNPLGRLKGKIKAELKRKAHHLRPVVQIGHSGVTDDVIAEIRRQLLIHELIKVKWASLTKEDGNKKEQARDLAERVGAHFISLIGQVVVLYRRREDKIIS
ncbi:MAG: ribosome assembly RNA-binding protein YhbY [Deltaproteobacteria bacterium]|nr:ribosome assembly RNA-binding protein YhbY [Deltaproteobacteria bacterium]MBW2067481.1 ribosome assembly RNA-binding protein YhbY [Deltaproteobacteria bacterium]